MMGRTSLKGILIAAVFAALSACGGDDEVAPGVCAGKGGDSDGDDVCQAFDNCPDDANPDQRDRDQDGVGDSCDSTPGPCDDHGGDRDNDTVCDDFDNCPAAINLNQLDRDGDGIGDACDHPVSPAGGSGGQASAANGEAGAPTGGTGNSAGAAATGEAGAGVAPNAACNGLGGDRDGDDWCGASDNCISVYNPDQADADDDGKGDACDEETCDGIDNDGNGEIDEGFSDQDEDGVADCVDKCTGVPDEDADEDGTVDCKDKCPGDPVNDPDGDNVCAKKDNCPLVGNYNQADSDRDGIGDACEIELCDNVDNDGDGSVDEQMVDTDNDGICDDIDWCANDVLNDYEGDGVCSTSDNCAGVTNPTQADSDGDGVGDACDLDSATACGASAALGSTPLAESQNFVHVVADPQRALVYGTVASNSVTLPNQFVAFDPATKAVVYSLNVGSNPNRIALSSDGSRAYVGLDGSASIRVVDLAKRRACYQFSIGSIRREVHTAVDLAVLGKQAESVVVASRGNSGILSVVQVFDNGNPRPDAVQSSYVNRIEAIDETRVWAVTSTSSYDPSQFFVDDRGIRQGRPVPDFGYSSTSSDLLYAGELIYLSAGQVIDPATNRLLGTFPGTGVMAVDVVRNEAYFAYGSSSVEVRIYDIRSFTYLRTVTLTDPKYYSVNQVVRFGANGLLLSSTSYGLRYISLN